MRYPSFRFLVLISIVAAALYSLSVCSAVPFLSSGSKSALKRVSIEAREHANENQATAVDIVVIYDAKLLEILPKNAIEWFDKKSSFMASVGQNIDVVSLQIPPISLVDVKLPKGIAKAVYVMSYANYIAAEGQMVGNLSSYKCAKIILQPQRVDYVGCS